MHTPRFSVLVLTAICIGSAHAQGISGKTFNGDLYTVFQPVELVLTKGDKSGAILLRSKDSGLKIRMSGISESRPGFPGNDPEAENDPNAGNYDKLPPSHSIKTARTVVWSCVEGASITYLISR